MTAQQTAAVIANAREAVAKRNADYLERTIVALADERDALADKLETEQIECTVARRFLTEERAELVAAVKLLRDIYEAEVNSHSSELAELAEFGARAFLARHEGRR